MAKTIEESKKQEIATAIAGTRLPYHPALKEMTLSNGSPIDLPMWRTLVESIYPSAQSIEGVAMAIRYCQVRKLDILKRPVHVVPVYSSKLKKTVEMVWPGINEYRTTAARTEEYAGCDPTECGPLIETSYSGQVDEWEDGRKTGTKTIAVKIKHHEWMRVTVYRIVKGARCPFHGPRVYFDEIYSRIRNNVEVPNDRWQKSPNGQLEKCAEAAALRKAFPEEIGSEPTADEMEGKVVDITPEPLRTVSEKEIADAVAAKMGEQPQCDPKEGSQQEVKPEGHAFGEPPPNADWESMLEEILIALGGCSTQKHVNETITEFQETLMTISEKAPREIQLKWTQALTQKINSFKKDKA